MRTKHHVAATTNMIASTRHFRTTRLRKRARDQYRVVEVVSLSKKETQRGTDGVGVSSVENYTFLIARSLKILSKRSAAFNSSTSPIMYAATL